MQKRRTGCKRELRKKDRFSTACRPVPCHAKQENLNSSIPLAEKIYIYIYIKERGAVVESKGCFYASGESRRLALPAEHVLRAMAAGYVGGSGDGEGRLAGERSGAGEKGN